MRAVDQKQDNYLEWPNTYLLLWLLTKSSDMQMKSTLSVKKGQGQLEATV